MILRSPPENQQVLLPDSCVGGQPASCVGGMAQLGPEPSAPRGAQEILGAGAGGDCFI